MIQTKGIFMLSILLFSFLTAASLASGSRCCNSTTGERSYTESPGGSSRTMMQSGGWWSGPDHDMDCLLPGAGGRTFSNLTKKDAKKAAEDYLYHYDNTNLKVGKAKEKVDYFEIEIVNKDNDLVDKLIVDKQNGWMKSIR